MTKRGSVMQKQTRISENEGLYGHLLFMSNPQASFKRRHLKSRNKGNRFLVHKKPGLQGSPS